MIAISCEHCGVRMKIRDDDGNKKAECPTCGRIVEIAGGKPTRRGRSSGLSGSGERTTALPFPPPEPTKQTPPATGADPGSETGSAPPIHEIATRAEASHTGHDSLTSFLSPPQAPDEIGRLGRYRVLGVVGSGGMGVVFKAEDPQLLRVVALKAMLPALAASATARLRFLREAQSAARLEHDRIVQIYQVDEANGVPYLAMPFLKGESLETRLRRAGGPLPIREVLRIGLQIAEGLAAIHELGLIHRDIKPGNVWLEGDAGRVKILDFGLARAASGDVHLTQDGSIVGSPAFMAPEQASRQLIDGRVDLFSLGCVLYLMATGCLPFEGDDALSTLFAITTAEPTPPHERNPLTPAPVSRLVLALLAKKPADRLPSAQAVIEAIGKLMN